MTDPLPCSIGAATEEDDEADEQLLIEHPFMTPDDLATARYRLGLSTEGLAALGGPLGAQVAASGRTVRRWESGTRAIPGPVALLIRLALASSEVRRLVGAMPWQGD